MYGSRIYHTTPRKGSDFPGGGGGGGGGEICLIFQGGGEGVHLREIFSEGSRDA